MNTALKYLMLILSLNCLVACDTSTRVRNQPIIQQLNPYIGKSPALIEQQLDLQNIGIKFIKQPVLEENLLTYTFQRTLATAIPTGISTPNEKGKMIQTQIATTSDSLNSLMSCHIIFKIENGVAQSYQFKGRAC